MEAISISIAFIAGAGAVLSLAFRALSAERRAGEQKARADVLDANHTVLARDLADTAAQLKDAQERLDDLANELVQCAADAPTDGSYLRLLGIAQARRANGGDSPSAVHHDESADAGRDDGLLRPGE